MSNTPFNCELQELILAHLDDAITPEQSLKLKCLLKEDAETRKYYTECVMLYAALKRYCAASPQVDRTILALAAFSDPSIIPFAEKKVMPLDSGVLDDSFWEAMAEDEATAPGIRIPKEIQRPELIRKISHEKVLWSFKKSTVMSILVNIAAMLLLVLFIRFAPIRGKSFAYVIEGYQAEIQDVESGFRQGQYLDDKPLKLNKGLLKIQMNDGSVVLLEGPTEIRLENNDQLFLIQGKLTAHVPREAIGFTVRTPSASIIDYGTEFGVLVDQYAKTETHVLKGTVKLGLGSNPRILEQTIRLSENQAGSVSGQLLTKIPAQIDQFVYEIPSPFELTAKSLGVSMYLRLQGDSVSSLQDVMHVLASDIEINPNLSALPGPFLGNGKKSYALHIQGSDSAIKINDTQSIPQNREGDYSIGYWVRFDDIREQVVSGSRIDVEQGSHFRSVVMTKDGFLQHCAHRTTTSSKWRVVTSPDAFQAGKWYFIMITRGVRGDNTKNMYVNGKCVASKTREIELVKLDTFDSFQFGGDIGDYPGFEGDLAEILLFPRVLDDREVQLLYEAAINNP